MTSVSTDALRTSIGRRDTSDLQPHDLPAQLPRPRGPMTAALLDYLQREPASTRVKPARLAWSGATAEAATDHDLQLALWLAYELPYRGLVGVDDAWEWHPGLVEVIEEWEDLLLDALVSVTGGNSTAARTGGPALSQVLMCEATLDQFREFLVHRSIYYLKEADPHTWGIPRLSGSVQAAIAAARPDGDGSGDTGANIARRFPSLLAEWGLDTRYGHYLDRVPGITLLTSNMISMFGLHRRFRTTLVGYLAMFELTSPNPGYAPGHRRLDGSEGAARMLDEQVVADAVHHQIATQDLGGGLTVVERRLSQDLLFGVRCAAYAHERFADWVLPRWAGGRSSLLQGF
jgi:hypothetical protein